jgi:hypothetical protein
MATIENVAGVQAAPTRAGHFKRLLSSLGPGLITGASDDDPSGIGTYTVAGTSLGYATLWTALVSFPMLAQLPGYKPDRRAVLDGRPERLSGAAAAGPGHAGRQ